MLRCLDAAPPRVGTRHGACGAGSGRGSRQTADARASRVFNGTDEVTAEITRDRPRAGDRGEPLLHASSAEGRVEVRLAAGIYDVQAIHEREGRVLNIRWANRLVIMPYPDEPGPPPRSHQLPQRFWRAPDSRARRWAARTSRSTSRQTRQAGGGAVHDVDLPALRRAGRLYDLLARGPAGASTWHPAIDVPLDRTRLWVTSRCPRLLTAHLSWNPRRVQWYCRPAGLLHALAIADATAVIESASRSSRHRLHFP